METPPVEVAAGRDEIFDPRLGIADGDRGSRLLAMLGPGRYRRRHGDPNEAYRQKKMVNRSRPQQKLMGISLWYYIKF